MRSLLNSDTECQKLEESLRLFAVNPPKALRLHRLRKGEVRELVEAHGFSLLKGVDWEKQGYFADFSKAQPLSTHPVLGAGLAFIQEPGAMEAVDVLDPKPGDLVLDLAAAPGAKATQIGERLEGRGWLFANDPVKGRAERLDLLVSRHGIYNSSIYSIDPGSLAARFPQAFDKILVDAPCSGESLFAKRTDHRADIRDVDVQGCARRQFKILEFASEMLKPGGRMVYSTCTYSREENEDIVEGFLENNPDFKLLKSQRRFPHTDGVAGGYLAHLAREGSVETAHTFSSRALATTAGLIRHGAYRWNKERDLYLEAMSAVGSKEVFSQLPANPYEEELDAWSSKVFEGDLEISEVEARKYLKGEAIALSGEDSSKRGLYRVLWKGYPLGLVKAVGDRGNNLLPRILRGIESSL